MIRKLLVAAGPALRRRPRRRHGTKPRRTISSSTAKASRAGGARLRGQARALPFRAADASATSREPAAGAGCASFCSRDQDAVGRMAGGAERRRLLCPRRARPDARRHAARERAASTTFARRSDATANLDPESVLFHEYTHHFTFQYFPATYPVWYSEGFAEFWGTTAILPGDVVEVGAPANHRFSTFRGARLAAARPAARARTIIASVGGADIFLLYAEGWLLVRYMFDHPDRQRQINEYLRLINNGTAFDEAARQAIPGPRRVQFRAVRLCRPGPLQRRAPAVPDDRRRPDHGPHARAPPSRR